MHNILVLCTGNSARSIIGEVLLRDLGGEQVLAHSAGSHPAGTVNPGAVRVLQRHGHDTNGVRSKSWDEFAAPEGPEINTVITVCDNAAGEACPVWTGSPETLHWGLPDPHSDDDFEAVYAALRRRIEDWLAERSIG